MTGTICRLNCLNALGFRPSISRSQGHLNIYKSNFVQYLPLCFALATALSIVVGVGGILRWIYPAAATLIAYSLYCRVPVTYVSFVWWLWFLSPFVRRIVDYRAGWVDPSPILLAPPLATLVCFPALIRHEAELWKPQARPFLLALGSVMYGFVVGILRVPLASLATASLSWFAPIIFGFFLYCSFRSGKFASDLVPSLQRTFLWGTFLMGIYGIFQFVVAPGWDQLWMIESGGMAGTPEPFGIRVFSTMNAPGPFAAVLVAGLLLLINRQGLLVKLAILPGYLALVLSSSRLAWLAWLVGVAVFALRQKRYAARITATICLLVTSIFLLVTENPSGEDLNLRFKSFANLQDDTSFQERESGYSDMIDIALNEPFGRGIGAMELGTQTTLGSHDSGFWELLLCLGWFSGTLYLLSLFLMAFSMLRPAGPQSSFVTAASCISIGLLSQLLLGSIMLGMFGLALWSFAAIYIAAQQNT